LREVLSKNKKEFLRKYLIRRLEELLDNTRQTAVNMSDFSDKLSDEVDRASMSSDRDIRIRLTDRESKLILKIKDALGRIEDGSYGTCEECGEEIPVKRLMARPVRTLCIDCKRVKEADERIRGFGK
jgi:DnaK suppressor protein